MNSFEPTHLEQLFGPLIRGCRVSAISQRDTALTCTLTGTIPLPHMQGVQWAAITTTVLVIRNTDSTLALSGPSTESPIEPLDLAENIRLENGCVYLVSAGATLSVCIKGQVRFKDSGSSFVTGDLDAPLAFDPAKPDAVSLTALLTNASLTIKDGFTLSGGTVWLTVAPVASPGDTFIPRPEDEEAERLYQSDKPLSLKSLDIVGIGDRPITFSARIDGASHKQSRLLLTIFPAQLRSPLVGEDTMLFVHGANYDEPFTLDTRYGWNASVSSNVFLQLKNPADPAGFDLVRGTAALCGTLSGTGFTARKLLLEAELTSGIAFPQSDRPQPLPDQKIRLVIDESGAAAMDLALFPVVSDGLAIRPFDEGETLIHGTLCPRGLLLKRVSLEHEGGDVRKAESFIVDSQCRESP